MSSMGEYPVPGELKDEDKWFKFFTLKQLFIVGSAGVICAGIIKLGIAVKMIMPAAVISALIMAITIFMAVKKISKKRYILGSGRPMYSLIVARLIRMSHKKICIKYYNDVSELIEEYQLKKEKNTLIQ